MRLESTPELEAFRREVRAFVAEHAPGVKTHTGVRAPDPELMPAIRAWTAALFGAGYLGINWPAEFGGRPDAHPLESFIVAEEIARARTWAPIGAASLAAAAIIEFGTPEQQKQFLPRIRSCEDVWCQLFSEPGAGSDLASLQTRAVLDGDEYVVDGQKVWTTNGQHADIGYLLARTNPTAPKHRGITASGVAANGVELFRVLEDLNQVAGTPGPGGRVPLTDSAVRQTVGELATRVHVNAAVVNLVRSRMLSRTETPADAPLSKIFFSEISHDLAVAGMGLQGTDGLLTAEDPAAVAGGWWQDAYLYARAYTIAGGANEVLRNVVAERALGLPRDPA